MSKINATSALLAFIWMITSLVIVMIFFEKWFKTYSPILFIIPAGMLLIHFIFENILKYDYFDKEYKNDEK
ncbi:hypothetical protein FO441_08680 [Salinicoccus cyprini]|uniref:Uncharacterized protein n=1 Tax=Salinicoccus cyprini TaxID=2493691 RepID=A0A558AU17_9STAP|nr:hypothetical protein [Salinicoccus cyprini]TVT27772.1 hypothetical protein FO441_08680 [Salinicoccus cyprini]